MSFLMKSRSVTIHLKATEQYFSVVLFIVRYKMVPAFVNVVEPPKCSVHFKATEHYSTVVPFVVLCEVVVTFKSVDEIPKCDYHLKATVCCSFFRHILFVTS